jgi:hypothetical protein
MTVEHRERQDGRPLRQESEHDQDEPNVLGMAHMRIRPGGREPVGLLSRVEYRPRRRQRNEPPAIRSY